MLSQLVDELRADGHYAHLCDGDERQVVAWSQTDLTVRIAAPTNDELWIVAGAGMLVRFIADSDGQFGPEPGGVARAILHGRAVELLDGADGPSGFRIAGWQVETDAGLRFAGGIEAEQAAGALPVTGPFGHIQ